MPISKRIWDKRSKLLAKYRSFAEDAYNFREIDHAKSDLSEYEALKILNELNKLNFLERDLHISN